MSATAEAMTPEQAAAPEVKGGVVPYLSLNDAAAAAEFYKKAFGAEEVARAAIPGGTKIIHLHLYINGGSVMLADPFEEHGAPYQPAQGYMLHLQVEDVDAWWKRAVEAGAEIKLPLQVMFWGDRYGQVKDPFGVTWSIAKHGA